MKPLSTICWGLLWLSSALAQVPQTSGASNATTVQCPQVCGELWGVVTTIFDPTEATTRWVRDRPDTCLVVVADKKTPEASWRQQGREHGGRVVYLSVQAQEMLPFRIIKHIPWNHFGRKNLGYLFALKCGATRVFDFDDDNILHGNDESGAALRDAVFGGSALNIQTAGTKSPIFNPYILFDPKDREGRNLFCWPRGQPLQTVSDPLTWEADMSQGVRRADIGVLQALADHNPDVDAVYRMTGRLPITFKRSGLTLAMPRGTFVPFNAQATVFEPLGLWGMLLPVTVDGRVSDIWRSFVVTRLLWEASLSVAFTSPLVTQVRNPHSYFSDFNAEDALYHKSFRTLDLLAALPLPSSSSLSALFLHIFEALAAEDIVGAADVDLAKAWVLDLDDLPRRLWPPRSRPMEPFQLHEPGQFQDDGVLAAGVRGTHVADRLPKPACPDPPAPAAPTDPPTKRIPSGPWARVTQAGSLPIQDAQAEPMGNQVGSPDQHRQDASGVRGRGVTRVPRRQSQASRRLRERLEEVRRARQTDMGAPPVPGAQRHPALGAVPGRRP